MTKEKRHYLQDLLDYLQISAASFAKSLGYSSPNKIYYILRFRNGMSVEVAKDIMMIYSNVNYDWLLTGEGDMLKENKKINIQSAVSNDVTMSREIFDLLKNQSETILSQQRTIEKLADREKTSTAGAV